MKFDEATKTIEMSVRELAEGEGYARIGFERGEGWNRLGLGADLHSRVLRERGRVQAAYRSEVFVQARWAVEDWTAVVTGRLDGCVEQAGGGWLVEEFKSTYVPTAEIRRSGGAYERHQRQLLLYCHMWARLGHAPVAGALVYVDLASGGETAISVGYDGEEVDRDVTRRLQRLLAVWRAEAATRAKKALAATAMPFPHDHPRPGQQIMIDAVRRTLAAGGHLLAEAPTGSGKTAAALHPALAAGLAAGRQVVFLTSKTLQQRMAVAALRAMNTEGAFRTLQVRNKEKMCANDRVLCHEDFCPYAKGYPEKMERSGLVERLRASHWHYDPDAVFAAAKRENVCPFETQLELARSADALVADYNYVFDPGAALRHLGPDELGEAILLVDEAHNLPDRARQIFSPEILEKDFHAVALALQPGELFEALAESIEKMVELMVEQAKVLAAAPSREAIAEIEPPKEALRAVWKEWEGAFVRYLSWKREVKYTPPEDPVVDLHFAWQRLIAALNLFGPGFTGVIERRPDGLRLAVICLDPARALGPIFRASASSILFSATLSAAGGGTADPGAGESAHGGNLAAAPVPAGEPESHDPAAGAHDLCRAGKTILRPWAGWWRRCRARSPATASCFFRATRFSAAWRRAMPPTRARVLTQRPQAGEAERQEIFAALAAPPPEGLLVLAVLGGMYAEGVDYPGRTFERGLHCLAGAAAGFLRARAVASIL